MNIKKKKLPPDDYEFCFVCGRKLSDSMYVLDFGTNATSFELCRGCLKSMKKKAERALEKA